MVLIAPVKPVAGEIIPSSKEDLTIDAASETKSAQSWFARIRFSCFASLFGLFLRSSFFQNIIYFGWNVCNALHSRSDDLLRSNPSFLEPHFKLVDLNK